jgi:hypothetical protein
LDFLSKQKVIFAKLVCNAEPDKNNKLMSVTFLFANFATSLGLFINYVMQRRERNVCKELQGEMGVCTGVTLGHLK